MPFQLHTPVESMSPLPGLSPPSTDSATGSSATLRGKRKVHQMEDSDEASQNDTKEAFSAQHEYSIRRRRISFEPAKRSLRTRK